MMTSTQGMSEDLLFPPTFAFPFKLLASSLYVCPDICIHFVVILSRTMQIFVSLYPPLPPPSHTTDPPTPTPTPPSSSTLLQIISLPPTSLPPSPPTHPSQHAMTTALTKD